MRFCPLKHRTPNIQLKDFSFPYVLTIQQSPEKQEARVEDFRSVSFLSSCPFLYIHQSVIGSSEQGKGDWESLTFYFSQGVRTEEFIQGNHSAKRVA